LRSGFAFVCFSAALTMAGPALSCSVAQPKGYAGSAQQRRDVRIAIEQSAAVIDGEVVRPWTREKPALIEVYQLLKGWTGNFIEVGGPSAGSDCSIALKQEGARLRMILSGGPNPYDLYRDDSQARLEDKILKSDRRKTWPRAASSSPGR
jgi:hypothetical protein